jgi:hypothetical protein
MQSLRIVIAVSPVRRTVSTASIARLPDIRNSIFTDLSSHPRGAEMLCGSAFLFHRPRCGDRCC